MRAYFFVNSWLSGRQKGIQATHCATKMAVRSILNAQGTDKEREAYESWLDWAQNHETVIMLEGGRHLDLAMIASLFGGFEHGANEFARTEEEAKWGNHVWAAVQEDQDCLNKAFTCVGIILDERIYETASLVRESGVNLDLGLDNEKVNSVVGHADLTYWEIEIIKLVNSCKMAGE